LALHNEEYDKIAALLEKIDPRLQDANADDLQRVYKALEQVEKTLQIKQNEIVSQLKDLGDLKKFQF